MKILIVGDLVGSPGRTAFARVATTMKAKGNVDFIVVNAENSAGGKGLTSAMAEEIFSAGADVITLGDHTWDQKEIRPYLDMEPRVVRPANFAPGCPGHGCVTVDTEWGDITVINIIGRVFMSHYDCPFRAMDALLKKEPTAGKICLIDFHAEATSEKIVMGRYLDGRVSCIYGTHTHVQTSDDTILPKGSAYITDLGMTGSKDSSLGRDLDSIIERFLTGMPSKFKVATNNVMLEGILLDIDPTTGKVEKIQRVREAV